MVERQVTLVNRLGLHARAAAKLVQLTGQFSAKVRLHDPRTGRSADAVSILDLLTLGASLGVVLDISADGEDEIAAIESVSQLFADGFGENE